MFAFCMDFTITLCLFHIKSPCLKYCVISLILCGFFLAIFYSKFGLNLLESLLKFKQCAVKQTKVIIGKLHIFIEILTSFLRGQNHARAVQQFVGTKSTFVVRKSGGG